MNFREYANLDEGASAKLAKVFQSLIKEKIQLILVTADGEFIATEAYENALGSITFKTKNGLYSYGRYGKPSDSPVRSIRIDQ